MSYRNEKPGPANGENGRDPSSGGLFSVNYKKHEDLKNMLDQNKDSLKLDAMKRIIGMIAKGKNASSLFPAVVKNVACKNIEVKKLVYVYLERYAEEQQDLALLSISTFQRGLKDPNQLIRASALRVLSSIRVPIIVPIMMLSIKDGVSDMSPFVRKTAAHAIPKLYSLDKEQKENLIEIIEKLLSDRTTLVAGSVIMAFQEVCPERIDLVHRHYRKLCGLLVDVDEWGQIAILSMLTRYARTQFLDPNKYGMGDMEDKPFYEESESEDSSSDKEEKSPKYIMDPDLRLLLKSARPLLQSRNAAVVMAVAQLYYHLAPKSEVSTVAKALVRLLRGRREVQAIVLQNIASMTLMNKGIFVPYLKSFYVRSTDPTHVRGLKLEVLTNLASETNIAVILREFQTYVQSSDKQFVAHTIQAIARCATNITEVTDTCLSGLVSLLANRDDTVVAESIVVIKKLLQMNPSQHSDIIKHMAKLVDNIQVPMAKASILWLIGEYSEFVPKIAPDVLRKAAKHFTAQEDIVKLQIINLAAKLFLTNQKQTKLLTQYVLQLAKYDQNYDIRDRSRFIRHLILPATDASAQIHKHAKKFLLAPKPAPVLESPFKGRDVYQLGSLSHAINSEASGYQKLPEFPEVQPDTAVRNVELPKKMESAGRKKKGGHPVRQKKKKSFYSDEDESTEEDKDNGSSGSEDSEDSDSQSSDDEESSTSDESTSSSTEGPDSRISESDAVVPPKRKAKKKVVMEEIVNEESDSDSDSSSGSEDSSSEEESSESEPEPPKKMKNKKPSKEVNLLDLDDFLSSPTQPISPAAGNVILTPMLTSDLQGLSLTDGGHDAEVAGSSSSKMFELLHRVTGEGLSATYRYTRQPCIYGDKMIAIQLEIVNNGDKPITNVHMEAKKLASGLKVHEFKDIETLQPGANVVCSIGVDFCDTTQSLNFDLCTHSRRFAVSIKIPVGELVKPISMPENQFLKQQGLLAGMNENKATLDLAESQKVNGVICQKVTEVVNVSRVPSTQENVLRFAGKTANGGSYMLVQVQIGDKCELKVNCDKMVICSMVFKQLQEQLRTK